MWTKTRSQWLCTEEAQAIPALHGRGTECGGRWQLEMGGENQEKHSFFGDQRKTVTSKKSQLVGCGQDISRNMVSGIDFETGPCSVLQWPPAAGPPPRGKCLLYTATLCSSRFGRTKEEKRCPAWGRERQEQVVAGTAKATEQKDAGWVK